MNEPSDDPENQDPPTPKPQVPSGQGVPLFVSGPPDSAPEKKAHEPNILTPQPSYASGESNATLRGNADADSGEGSFVTISANRDAVGGFLGDLFPVEATLRATQPADSFGGLLGNPPPVEATLRATQPADSFGGFARVSPQAPPRPTDSSAQQATATPVPASTGPETSDSTVETAQQVPQFSSLVGEEADVLEAALITKTDDPAADSSPAYNPSIAELEPETLQDSVNEGINTNPQTSSASETVSHPPNKPLVVNAQHRRPSPGRAVVQKTIPQENSQVQPARDEPPPEERDIATEQAFPTVTLGDTVAEKDAVGFEPYVRAVAAFLSDPDTEPPLTMSIEGEWGAGKSSFMAQLKTALADRGIKSVEFNAWRYEKEEHLWAAFATSFTISARQQFGVWQRISPWWKLTKLRFQRFGHASAWKEIVQFGSMIVVYLFLLVYGGAYFLYRGHDAWKDAWDFATTAGSDKTGLIKLLTGFGGSAGLIVLLWIVLRTIGTLIGNPLNIEFRKHNRVPDYESQAAFIDRFHKDFADIALAYTKGSKQCVFIDDIDRCEPTKSANLMEAIHLMIPECKNLIFVIGMDRERVAAAVAVKNEKLLRYLPHPIAQASDSKNDHFDRHHGLTHGYAYLDKFIQVSCRVPHLDQTGVVKLITEIRARRSSPLAQTPAGVAKPAVQSAGPTNSERNPDARLEKLRERLAAEEVRITCSVAPVLEYNPRRVKHFLSSFRLTSYIAEVTGALDSSADSLISGKLTLGLIGLFVAINLRWRLLLADIEKDPHLLGDLQELAIVKKHESVTISEALKEKVKSWSTLVSGNSERNSDELSRLRNQTALGRWSTDQALTEVLGSSFKGHRGGPERYGFGESNVRLLLSVSPVRKRSEDQ